MKEVDLFIKQVVEGVRFFSNRLLFLKKCLPVINRSARNSFVTYI